MNSSELKERFAQSFKRGRDELEGYTYEKVFIRAEHIETQADTAIFEIERHRAILGETYSMGMGMASYITYWPRFAFDVTTGIRTPLPEKRQHEVEIDHVGLADTWTFDMSFYCTRLDDGSNKIDESCGGDQAILNDASEIRRFVESIVDSWDIAESLSNELSDDLSIEEIERHAATLHGCVAEKLEQMVTEAWKDCENEAIV